MKSVEVAREILNYLSEGFKLKDLNFQLWDGSILGSKEAETTIKINYPWTLRELLLRPSELKFAEGYIYNHYDIVGSIYNVFPFADFLLKKHFGFWGSVKLLKLLLSLPKPDVSFPKCYATLDGEVHCKNRDRKAIEYHYDLSNEFYSLFLDKNMVYSCAYFETEDDSLDRAQEQKLDYICRKLRLKPNEKFLDIGCGWGALVIHAAKYYGVYAHGITLSRNQARYAKRKIEELGLKERCKVEIKDYRDLDKFNYYDKMASIGMFEHVGRKMYPVYMKQAFNLLKEGGVFLNHGISIDISEYSRPKSEFIQKYVFPDGELLPVSFVLEESEKAGFEIRDVENLREHYMLTLKHWVKRLENNYLEALKYVGEERYRIWRLYMAASAYNFERGKIAVYQTLLVKRTESGNSYFPLTRKDWYGC